MNTCSTERDGRKEFDGSKPNGEAKTGRKADKAKILDRKTQAHINEPCKIFQAKVHNILMNGAAGKGGDHSVTRCFSYLAILFFSLLFLCSFSFRNAARLSVSFVA